MSTTIYSVTASRAIRTSSAVECHQEPFSFPSGFSESPTPASTEGASLSSNIFVVTKRNRKLDGLSQNLITVIFSFQLQMDVVFIRGPL